MSGRTVVGGAVQGRRWADAVGSLAAVLAFLMAAAPPQTCVADDPVWLEVTDSPATTLRIVESGDAASDPVSDEIWISSDEPALQEATRPELTVPGAKAAAQASNRTVLRLRPAELATRSVGRGAPKPASLAPTKPADTGVQPLSAPQARLEIPRMASLPRAPVFRGPVWTTPGRMRLLPGPVERPTDAARSTPSTEAQEAATVPTTPRRARVASTQAREAAQHPDAKALAPEKATPVTAQSEASDDVMFHTTSTRAKSAATVFRPLASSNRAAAAPGLAPNAETALRMPAGPTNEPDPRQARIAAVANRGFPKAASRSEEFSLAVRRSKTLHTKLDVSWAAVADASVCEVVRKSPRAVSIIGKSQGTTQMTLWFRDNSHRPVTCLVRVAASPQVGLSGKL